MFVMIRPFRKSALSNTVVWLSILVSAVFVADTSDAFIPSGLHTRLPSTKLRFSLKSPSPKEKLNVNVNDELTKQIEPFDPFQYQQTDSGDILPSTVLEQSELALQEDKAQLGIWTARIILLIVAMLWGTNFASVKYLETLCFHPPCNHPPSEAAFARFGVAALVSIPLLFRQRLDVILGGLECGLWITLGYITQAVALQSIDSGKCAFICSLTVVIVPLISSIFFGKSIKPIHVLSAAVALSGVGVLEGLVDVNSLLGIHPALADTAATTAAASSATMVSASTTGGLFGFAQSVGIGKGDLLALGQPLGFGLSFLRIEHYVEKFKNVENRVLTIAAAQCVAVGMMSLLWVLYDYHGVLPNFGYMMEPHRLAAIGWTGVMTTVVAIFFEGIALQTATATEASLAFATEPVWASLFGAWLLHEKLNVNTYVGGGVILSACLLGGIADLHLPNSDQEHEPKSS